MKKIQIHNECSDYHSYRAARVKSMFNCESGANFKVEAEIPNDDGWQIGLIVGPSGTGKTSIGKQIWSGVGIYEMDQGWAHDKPIIDSVADKVEYDEITRAFSSVGLGSVPTWLRPYCVLSNGERFRAGLARLILDPDAKQVVVDEFTSVVDRQVAQVGAAAFQRAWRKRGGQAVLLSCHYDIIDWLEPDWVYDMKSGELARGCLWRRPNIQIEIYQTNSKFWPLFENHHYLKLPLPIAAKYYVGFVDSEPVSHLAVSPALQSGAMRLARLVVMPEWQGVGIGTKFLNAIAKLQFTDHSPYHDRTSRVVFQTAHPGLCGALRKSSKWVLISQTIGGDHKGRCCKRISRAAQTRYEQGSRTSKKVGYFSGYGGHFRSIQGFRTTRTLQGMQT